MTWLPALGILSGGTGDSVRPNTQRARDGTGDTVRPNRKMQAESTKNGRPQCRRCRWMLRLRWPFTNAIPGDSVRPNKKIQAESTKNGRPQCRRCPWMLRLRWPFTNAIPPDWSGFGACLLQLLDELLRRRPSSLSPRSASRNRPILMMAQPLGTSIRRELP